MDTPYPDRKDRLLNLGRSCKSVSRSSHAKGLRRRACAYFGEVVTQIQLGSSRTDSLVRILHAQPGSQVSVSHLFVLLSGLVFFAWGEIYSLFPATCTDIYGRKFATTNYGMLYTAKGTAALLVPLGNVLTTWTGNWSAVFVIAAILNIVAAVMALAVLRPMRPLTLRLNALVTNPQMQRLTSEARRSNVRLGGSAEALC